MTRRTITLEAPNGAKVRTAHSKRYFVVNYGHRDAHWIPGHEDESGLFRVPGHSEWLPEPELFAKVVKRTDSASAAYSELRRHPGAVVFEISPDGATKTQLLYFQLKYRAEQEKQAKRLTTRDDAVHRF
jgi:hypothetical protein